MRNRKEKKATTLIEILLYFFLLAIFLTAAVSFTIQIYNIYSLSTNMNNLSNDLLFFQRTISYRIETASSINISGSTFDSDQGRLSLVMPTASKSPTVIYYSSGDVYIQEGNAIPTKLNSIGNKFDYLRFQRITYTKSPDQVIIDAQISTSNETDINSITHSIPLHLAINLRK